MRKLVLLFITAAFVAGMATLVYADEYTVTGKVVSIDPAGKTIVVGTPEGEKTVVFQEGTQGFTEVKPGMSVEMTCIDLEGKACAKNIKVISVGEAAAPLPTKSFEGEVISIDPEGKTVVIKNPKGEQMTIEVKTPTAEKTAPTATAPAVTMPVTELKPGMQIKADCFDAGGKFCASKITVVSPEAAAKPVETEVVGEISSIDSTGKSVVIKTVTGEKTLYYQPTTTGASMSELEVGKKIKAYCLDVEGKTCIRDIKAAPAEAAPAQ
jgi:hypothetical protein